MMARKLATLLHGKIKLYLKHPNKLCEKTHDLTITEMCFAHQPQQPAKSQQDKTKVKHANNPSQPPTLTPMKQNVHFLWRKIPEGRAQGRTPGGPEGMSFTRVRQH